MPQNEHFHAFLELHFMLKLSSDHKFVLIIKNKKRLILFKLLHGADGADTKCCFDYLDMYPVFQVSVIPLLSSGQSLRGKVKGEGSHKGTCWRSVGLTCLLSLQRAVLSAVRLTTSLWETRVRATCLPTHSAPQGFRAAQGLSAYLKYTFMLWNHFCASNQRGTAWDQLPLQGGWLNIQDNKSYKKTKTNN